MFTMRHIAQNLLVFKSSSLKPRQNGPPFTNTWTASLSSVVGILGLCAALSSAAQGGDARYDATGVVRERMPAWQRFEPSRWPYDLQPAAGNRDRKPSRQPSLVVPSGNNRQDESTPYCRAACMIERTVGQEPARNKPIETTGVATPPLPAFRSVPSTVPVPAGRGMAPAAPIPPAQLLTDLPASLAAQMWFVAGAVLLCAVMVVPGAAVLAFFGLSGFIVGGLSLAIDLTWQYQVFIFAVLGMALVMLWIGLDPTRRRNDDPDSPVNDRGPNSLVGREFRLERPIEGGNGMLTFGGTSWRIAGRDCAAGKRVKVLRAEGTLLIVDPVEC
jgi:inner membrane protein